jgi:2-C-methyl-D-erythritol 2,4-cyclodiphosphate synthase
MSMTEFRVGIGVDAHAFSGAKTLVLGGVEFEGEAGLAGHSDGDVVAHALIDAILGAANHGDIGSLFPPTDDEWAGASSLDLLARAYAEIGADRWALVNADCVLVGEQAARVSVRATTTDRLGFAGRREGLAAQAVALLERP